MGNKRENQKKRHKKAINKVLMSSESDTKLSQTNYSEQIHYAAVCDREKSVYKAKPTTDFFSVNVPFSFTFFMLNSNSRVFYFNFYFCYCFSLVLYI